MSLSESEFTGIISKYSTIKNLVVKNVSNIERVGELFINIAGGLQIKNLKYLSITNCPNLTIIDIKCEQLENATLRNNYSLTHIYINSHKLVNMDCSKCNKLRLENIGIYIFRDINVLLCQNSCDGDVKKLENPNFNVFLTRILRFLINRFQ